MKKVYYALVRIEVNIANVDDVVDEIHKVAETIEPLTTMVGVEDLLEVRPDFESDDAPILYVP